MIHVIKNDGSFRLEVTVGFPKIYLDNWAIIDLAEGNPARRKRFLSAFRIRNADLLFSATNAADLAQQRGHSFRKVTAFLDKIGLHWVPVELNPFKVVEQEKNANDGTGFISRDFLEAFFKNRIADYDRRSKKRLVLSEEFFRLGAVVKWTVKSHLIPSKSREFDDLLKSVTKNIPAHKRRKKWLDVHSPIQAFDRDRPATFVCHGLLRAIILESGQLKDGDGLDFCHAAVGSAFANVAALDQHWKRRVEQLPKPHVLAEVYCGKKGELDRMVDKIETLCMSPSNATSPPL